MDPVYLLPTGEINLNVFDIITFQDILVSNTGKCKAASLSTYRSALYNYLKTQARTIPAHFGDELKDFFSGLKRVNARGRQSGGVKDSGKKSLKYSKYVELCKAAMKLEDQHLTHLFLVLSWSLMCRSNST
jgi:hypothetical protein